MFGKFFKKRPQAEEKVEEFTEIPLEIDQQEKVKVMIDKIDSLADADSVIKKVRSGNIVIARIKDLKENNVEELKHCISKINCMHYKKFLKEM